MDPAALAAAGEGVAAAALLRQIGGKLVTPDMGLPHTDLVKLALTRKVYALMTGVHQRQSRPRHFANSLFGAALVLDAVLDPLPRDDAHAILANLRRTGAVVLLTTSRDDIAELADTVANVRDCEVEERDA